MNFEEFYSYCQNKKGVKVDFPFDERTLTFKVGGKIFAITDIQQFHSINLKCYPEKAIDLRERYASIIPGFHMNKKHWNTVILGNDADDQLVKELIDHSYTLVLNALSKKLRNEIEVG